MTSFNYVGYFKRPCMLSFYRLLHLRGHADFSKSEKKEKKTAHEKEMFTVSCSYLLGFCHVETMLFNLFYLNFM